MTGEGWRGKSNRRNRNGSERERGGRNTRWDRVEQRTGKNIMDRQEHKGKDWRKRKRRKN